ncbi:MAG TPA: hypothetical protein VL022_00155 [Moheibacter sp.]|nr:hypothetical protein [Moheibacter sp.]
MAQFLGFIFFTFMAICGFWGILYFTSIIPFWLTGWFRMKAQERKGTLKLELRPTLPEQEGVTLLYSKK